MPAIITGSSYINSPKHNIALNSLSKRILSVHLIANPTMHENVHGEGHELTVTIIANTNVFHNVTKHRKTIEEIIHIHKPKISLLTRKYQHFINIKTLFNSVSYLRYNFRLLRLCVDFKYFIDTLLHIVTN
jgi:hypothetical protein